MSSIESMSDEEVLEYLKILERERSRIDARAMARLAELRVDTPDYVADELAVGASVDTAVRREPVGGFGRVGGVAAEHAGSVAGWGD